MSSNNKTIHIINYIFIFLVINYSLFVRFVTMVDSSGYALVLLSIFVVFLNYIDFRDLQLSKPISIWLIWCFYALVNYFLHDFSYNPMSYVALYRKIFIPLITLTIVVLEFRRDPIGIIKLCFITHIVYLFLGYYFDSGILYRIDDEENSLGNDYANISCFTLFYLVLLNKTKKIKLPIFIALAIICMLVLAMSGNRKSFGAGSIVLLFWVLSLFEIKKIWTWLYVLALFFLGIEGYNKLIDNTFIGIRMEMLEIQGESSLPPGAPEILSIFGNRASHYYYGWKLFLEHPLLGVGTNQTHVLEGYNFQAYTHSEYMAQLCDGGIVGFCLFALFYGWVISHVFKRQKNDMVFGKCMLGGLAALLFVYITAWAWSFPQYFICVGVLIGYCITDKDKYGLYFK